MDIQEIYNKVNLLIELLEKNNCIDDSILLKNSLFSGITSGEILDNLRESLKLLCKNKNYKKTCKEILRDINKL